MTTRDETQLLRLSRRHGERQADELRAARPAHTTELLEAGGGAGNAGKAAGGPQPPACGGDGGKAWGHTGKGRWEAGRSQHRGLGGLAALPLLPSTSRPRVYFQGAKPVAPPIQDPPHDSWSITVIGGDRVRLKQMLTSRGGNS